jgi:hypothetical protein
MPLRAIILGAGTVGVLAGLAQPALAQQASLNLQGATSALCPDPESLSLERPGTPSEPTQVSVGIFLLDLVTLDDVRQALTVDLYLLLQWTDARLADTARGSAVSVCGLSPDRVWMPLVQMQNVRRFEKHYQDITVIDVRGTVTWAQRLDLDLAVSLDLRDFPFDRQTLTAVVQPVFAGTGEVEFVVLNEMTGADDALGLTGWTLGTAESSIETRHAPRLGVDQAVFRIDLAISREAGFYVFKTFVPLMLIVFMSWAVFWIDPNQIGPQIALAATAMLTLIAYQFTFASMLPRISYLTIADRFTLGSSVLVFGALVEAVVTSTLARQGRLELAGRVDRWARALFPLALAAVIIVAFAA